MVLAGLSMIAQHPDLLCQLCIVGRNGSSLAARSEVLAWIKAEGCRRADGSGAFPAVFSRREILSSLGLACVLEHHHVIGLGDVPDCIHVGCLSVEVDGDDRP